MRGNLLFFIALAVSIAIHIALLPLNLYKMAEIKEQPRLITVNLAKYKSIKPQITKQKPQMENQIVQSDSNETIKPSEDAKYLSDKNHTVKEETRARKTGDFKNSRNIPNPSADVSVKPKQTSITPEIGKIKKGKGLTMKDLMMRDSDVFAQRMAPTEQEEISSTDDYLANTKEGEATLLNTREFVFYSYYNRIREQIKRLWQSKVQDNIIKIYKRGRAIASNTEKTTKLLITLDKEGNIIATNIISSSGMIELDTAAIDAFQEAAPFPNPPTGIIEHNGEIKLRWDFIVNTSNQKGIKIEYSYM